MLLPQQEVQTNIQDNSQEIDSSAKGCKTNKAKKEERKERNRRSTYNNIKEEGKNKNFLYKLGKLKGSLQFTTLRIILACLGAWESLCRILKI